MLSKILVPVDFSEPSTRAVKAAVALAQQFKAKVALVHVTAPTGRPGGFPVIEAIGMTTDPRRPARRALNAFAEKEVPAEVRMTCHVDSGVPYRCIIAAADEWNADLIVIGTHGQGWIPNALLGSTAERVVRHARCPVLVVRGRERRGTKAAFSPEAIRKILVPTDFSDNSIAALPCAVEWAREFGASLCLAHVVAETLPGDLTHLGLAISEDNRARKSAEKELDRIAAAHVPGGLAAELRVTVGTPAHEICRAAQKANADLIVMTSHGRTGFQHFWIGSVAERVVRHAPCAVLVIHNSGRPSRAQQAPPGRAGGRRRKAI